MTRLVPGEETVLDVEGRAVIVQLDVDPGASRLRVVLRHPRVPTAASGLVAAALEAATLAARGDTVFAVEGGCLTGRRRLIEPAPGAVEEAAGELARVVGAAAVLVESAADAFSTMARVRAMPEVPAGFAPTHLRPVPGFGRVASSTPTYATPDAEWSPVGHLEVGRCYLVLERRGDWVNVDDERGRSVWADGRLIREERQ